jgi:DnaJ-class molecular chaperone
METIENCPLCQTRGTRRKADGTFKPGKTPKSLACPACNGDGGIPRRRLQAIVRRGLTMERRQA